MNSFRNRRAGNRARAAAAGAFAAAAASLLAPAVAQEKLLTVCGVAGDQANALVELSRDFSLKSGVQVKYEFAPWQTFGQRMLGELTAKGKLCDLLVGDSQWLGTAATDGHYVELTDFLKKNNISMDNFLPAAVDGYSTWPKGSKQYWALPAMADVVAFSYRKDWFARPEIQKAFKERHGRDLAPPQTWNELMDIAKFFQGRTVENKKVNGVALFTERPTEGITMGVTNMMYAWGMQYANPSTPYDIRGYVNGSEAVGGLKFFKDLYDCCTPPGHSNAYVNENLDVYKTGMVAMQMNFISSFPTLTKDPQVGGDKTGFFAMPKGKVQAAQLGGQGISVVKYSDKRELALDYLKWFAQPAVQKKWWSLGGLSSHTGVTGETGFAKTTPYAPVFLESMQVAKDFWQEPTYAHLLASMQRRLHDYVVAGKGSPQAALDGVMKDWVEVFGKAGKQK